MRISDWSSDVGSSDLAGLVKGRNATSYTSIKTDMVNAGAKWADKEVVTDQGIITSRNPGDLEAFSNKIAEEILEGRHERRQDRKSVVSGKSVSVSVDLGGSRIITKKKN